MSAVTGDELKVHLEGIVVDAIAAGTGERLDRKLLDRSVDDLDIDSLILVDVLYALESALGEELDDEVLQMLMNGGSISQLIDLYVESHTP